MAVDSGRGGASGRLSGDQRQPATFRRKTGVMAEYGPCRRCSVKQVDEVAAVLLCGVDLAQKRVFETDGSLENDREVLAGHIDDVAFPADVGEVLQYFFVKAGHGDEQAAGAFELSVDLHLGRNGRRCQ